ncbi:monoacylglycerol lipase ABHD12-like [Acanthaster planci]|uniref:Monoacylglycerol lipase ABHD12-like n=1 Tax=Acanthaster planci TaxID=133434 RepID=A0A8B7YF29_ACAPL|nr:monoacylglycerol lipase ABHD12-like [Acanthaster planci]
MAPKRRNLVKNTSNGEASNGNSTAVTVRRKGTGLRTHVATCTSPPLVSTVARENAGLKSPCTTGNGRSKPLSWKMAVKTSALCCVCVYILVPVLAPIVPFITKQFLYLCLVKNPLSPSLQYPEKQHITGARNVHIGTIPHDAGIQLGLWQMLPRSLQTDSIHHNSQFDAALGDGKPIILYLHGNAGSRAADHRLLLYRLLTGMDFHVVALDYRGFGDSSGWPTAEGVVNDAESAYRWVEERSKDAPIYVWGHSMGSGIGSAMVKRLCKSGLCPHGVILESPYNSMHDAMINHPFTMPWWVLPGFLAMVSKAYEQEEAMFNTQENLLEVSCPILIIHAEDDFVVPFKLGKRLYDYSVEHRDKSLPMVTFQSFGYDGFGHRHIVDSPDLPTVIRNFMKQC